MSHGTLDTMALAGIAMPMALRTQGRQALRKVIGETPQKAFADSLGVSQPTVHAWLSGESRPKHELRVALERLHGIPAVSWMTAAERVAAFGAST